jgi:antagonist of KipI
MSLLINKPGLVTTIQDLGRYGFQKDGMIVSGAMDAVAMRIANKLVGNPDGAAALEITLLGPEILFEESLLIAIAGADLSPTIHGEVIPQWRPVHVCRGSVLRFGKPVLGCRAYLAVAGSFAIAKVMGSYSTYLRAGIGGLHGKPLQKGDRIPCQGNNPLTLLSHTSVIPAGKVYRAANWTLNPQFYPVYETNPTLRVLPGPEYELFLEDSQTAFWTDSFTVTPQSDRMGCRLQGPHLALATKTDLLSSAVTFGTIQVPPDGNPIILGADHQTTGGYPRIAQVITADFSTLAQLAPGSKVRFSKVSLPEAQQLYYQQEQKMEQLQQVLQIKRKSNL